MHRLDDVFEGRPATEDGCHGSKEREGGGEGRVVEGREGETELSSMAQQLTEKEERAARRLQRRQRRDGYHHIQTLPERKKTSECWYACLVDKMWISSVTTN